VSGYPSMPAPARPIGKGIYAADENEFFEVTKRRKAVVEALCTSLRNYLCFDQDLILEQAEKQVLEFRSSPGPVYPRVTTDQFERAAADVERLQSQLEQYEAAAEAVPEGMRDFILANARVLLEGPIRNAIEFRDHLQKRLEEQEPEPASGGEQ
jgi:hypothetical protein